MEHSSSSLNNPRQQAIASMMASVSPETWEQNTHFTESLKQKIKQHPIHNNLIIEKLNAGEFNLDEIRNIHMEYRHAIVQIFTDALLMAQTQTRQLEPRLAPGSKMPPRFLLTLNILDEFGFQPGLDCTGYYQGNPKYAHYPLFERVLDDLNISCESRDNYSASDHSDALRIFLEASFDNYPLILALLAAAEEQVIIFSPPLRLATEAVNVNVDQGYYYVHGTSDHENTNANDDDHEDDLWAALNQACTPKDYPEIESKVLQYLDMWNDFWIHQLQMESKGSTSDIMESVAV